MDLLLPFYSIPKPYQLFPDLPHLASHILGAAVKALPEQWPTSFGYVPLLAEAFTDIESFQSAYYKAAGWEALGQTKGLLNKLLRWRCQPLGT